MSLDVVVNSTIDIADKMLTPKNKPDGMDLAGYRVQDSATSEKPTTKREERLRFA